MSKNRLELTLLVSLILVALLASCLAVPTIWPQIASYESKKSNAAVALPTVEQTQSVSSK